MKVRMLPKSSFGHLRSNEIFDASPEDARIGIAAGALASVDPPRAPPRRATRRCGTVSRPCRPARRPRKSFADFCRAVVRHDTPYLAHHYGSRFVPAETDHLLTRQKAAQAESGGPTGGYTVPADYAVGMMAVGAENALIRSSATVAAMQSAALQVPPST